MKLFTKTIDKKLFAQFPKGGNLEGQKVIAKVFNPYGRGRWYIMNSDPDDPDYLWGIVELFEGQPEVGSFSRSELENIKVGAFKLPLERDLYFNEVNAMEVYRGLQNGKRYAEGGRIEDSGYLVRMAEEYAERENGKPVKKGEGMAKATKTEDGKYKYTQVTVFYKDGEKEVYEEEDFEDFFDVDEYAKGGTLKLLKKKDIEEGNYFYRRYEGAIGSFAWRSDTNRYNEGILYPLDEFDKEFYSHLRLKEGESLFRYKTEIMGDNLFPLIKINLDKMLVYFLEDAEDEKNPKFYSKGTPLQYLTLEEYYYEVREFAKGGKLSNTQELYVLELKSMSGVSKNAIEDFINQNDLSDDEVLNIIQGIGRKQINPKDFATALVGNKNNSEYKKLMAFIKSDKAFTPKLNYTSKRNILNVTINYEGKEYLVSGDDVITGAYKFSKGGLSDTHIYIPKRDVLKVTTKEGASIKSPLNGVWVKKEYFDKKEAKRSGKYEPSQATKIFAYKLTELAKDKELTASVKDSMVESLSMVDDFVNDLKYEIENNISGLAIETYANAVKFVSKKNKPRVGKNLAFYENPNVIDLFPEKFLKTPLLSKKAVPMKGNILDNEALLSELNKYTSGDALRPQMTSIHFDGKDVVATDANILIHLVNNVEVQKQSVCVSKICKDGRGDTERYPAYKDIIARTLNDSKYKSHTFDLDKLILLATWINNYYSVWENYIRTIAITTPNGEISFNPEKLLQALNMLKVLGVKKPIMYYEKPNRAVYFGEEGKLNGDPLNHNFILLMPLYSATAESFSLDVTNNKYKVVVPSFEYAKGGELEMGIKTEMQEHGMSKAEATKTAKEHLRENPKYYSIMKKVGLEDGGQLELFAKGGATFDDKVRAIKRNLVGKKVPSKYQGEYGKTYDKHEADESAKRIAGAMRKKYE